MNWTVFGATVTGPGHHATGIGNQDAWRSFAHPWGHGVAVSDGVGSRPLSSFGSNQACRAVKLAARHAPAKADAVDDALVEAIREHWLAGVAPIGAQDASATCLFVLQYDTGLLRLGALGDGCIAVVDRDGGVEVLREDKESTFSNITNALSPATKAGDWRTADMSASNCEAIVLCTDGVSDDLDNLEGFMTAFVQAHQNIPDVTASRLTREMLIQWPVPKHSDDKTLACLRRREWVDD